MNYNYKFIVFSDLHYGLDDFIKDVDINTQQEKIDLLLKAIKREENVDFVIANGDLIHSEFDSFKNHDEAMSSLNKLLFKKLNVKYYATAGNHDFLNNKMWNKYFKTNRSHSFKKGDFSFVLLDSSDLIGSRQVCVDETWLKDELNKHNNSKGILLFTHIPRHKGNYVKDELRDSPNCSNILNVLEKQNNLLLMGHGHFHYEDSIDYYKNIPLFFDGHLNGYGLNYYGFRIYEVYNTYIKTYQKDIINNKIVNEHIIKF